MIYLFAALLAIFMWLALIGRNQTMRTPSFEPEDDIDTSFNRRATFAVGNFWNAKPVFENKTWVIDVVLWYAWGEEEFPSFLEVKRGLTGHRIALQVIYNTELISYEELLKIFWSLIDPTDEDGQGEERGHHYTSAIFYHSMQQHDLAEASFEHEDSTWGHPLHIVTEILPYTTFFVQDEK